MNILNFVSFDLETGGLSPVEHEAISIGAVAYSGETLEAFPGGEFYSLMKPLNFDNLQDGALRVNGITREELKKAPEQKLVWGQFCEWLKKFKSGSLGWPIGCGKNIRDFDLKFVQALNALHGPKKEKTVLFHPRFLMDLENLLVGWFQGPDCPFEDWRMDTLRPWFGLEVTQCHNALVDARQTGELIMKFLRAQRKLLKARTLKGEPVVRFERCLADWSPK